MSDAAGVRFAQTVADARTTLAHLRRILDETWAEIACAKAEITEAHRLLGLFDCLAVQPVPPHRMSNRARPYGLS